jgi:hypothetical protein
MSDLIIGSNLIGTVAVTGVPTVGQLIVAVDGYDASWQNSSFAVGGDLSGTITSAKVIQIDGYELPTLISGYFNWTGSGWALTALPATLPPDGYASGDLTGSYPSPMVSGLDGYVLPPLVVGNLNWTGSAWALSTTVSFTAGGDLTGTSTSQKVVALDGYALPTFGSNVANLQWSGTAWQMTAPSAGNITSISVT